MVEDALRQGPLIEQVPVPKRNGLAAGLKAWTAGLLSESTPRQQQNQSYSSGDPLYPTQPADECELSDHVSLRSALPMRSTPIRGDWEKKAHGSEVVAEVIFGEGWASLR